MGRPTTRGPQALRIVRADGTVAGPNDKCAPCHGHRGSCLCGLFLTRASSCLVLASASHLGARGALRRFLPCEDVQVSIAGLSASSTTAWLFDASAGAFHDSPAEASGCDGKRWQSWNRATSSSTDVTAVLRMPSTGTVALHGAHATSTDAQAECAVMITDSLSLAVDPAGDDSACAAALPPPAAPGGDDDAAPPLSSGMKAHGCLQSIAWLLLLFPVRSRPALADGSRERRPRVDCCATLLARGAVASLSVNSGWTLTLTLCTYVQGAMAARYKSIFFRSTNSSSSSKSVSIALLSGEEEEGQPPAATAAAVGGSSDEPPVETWFTLHRGAQSVGSLASIAGVAVAWSSMGGLNLMHWHNRFGAALPLVLIAQVVAGVCRPAKDDAAKRRQFLLLHRVLGGVSLLLGLFCVCTGTHMAYGEPVTAYFGAVMGCVGVACALAVACEFKLGGGGAAAAQPALMWASFAAFAAAGVVSVAAILLVGHYHVHLDDAR